MPLLSLLTWNVLSLNFISSIYHFFLCHIPLNQSSIFDSSYFHTIEIYLPYWFKKKRLKQKGMWLYGRPPSALGWLVWRIWTTSWLIAHRTLPLLTKKKYKICIFIALFLFYLILCYSRSWNFRLWLYFQLFISSSYHTRKFSNV